MDPLLDGRTAVVTGGASGNGREIATRFAAEGAAVVVADVREDPRQGGTPTVERVRENGGRARFVDCDVTDPSQVEAAVEAAGEFGGVDVMVNNAGVFGGEAFTDVTPEAFDRMLDVNVRGTFFGAQAAARRMLAADRPGCIVNLSSVAGLYGAAERVSYCASKGAVRLMTYALAAELGPEGIRVNALHPGIVETAMTTEDVPILGGDRGETLRASIPSRRWGQPDDVADAALFLASDLADYVNGESLAVDGGLTNTR